MMGMHLLSPTDKDFFETLRSFRFHLLLLHNGLHIVFQTALLKPLDHFWTACWNK